MADEQVGDFQAFETKQEQPVVVQGKPVDANKDDTVSDVPYHNKETEQIAKDREAEPKEDKPYEFQANGYTVTEYKQDIGLKEPISKYKVSADGFEKVFLDKRDAEIYAMTHAEAHKDQPLEVSKS